MWTNRQTSVESEHTVIKHRSGNGRYRWLHINFLLIGFEQRLLEKRYNFVEYGNIAGFARGIEEACARAIAKE